MLLFLNLYHTYTTYIYILNHLEINFDPCPFPQQRTSLAQEAVGSEISGLSEKGGVITIDGFSKTAGHRCDRRRNSIHLLGNGR